MSFISPEEQQGVLVTIGVQANTIHSLQDVIVALQGELQRMKAKYEPDDTADNSVEVVHGGNGAADYAGGAPPTGSSGEGGGSGGNGPLLPEPSP